MPVEGCAWCGRVVRMADVLAWSACRCHRSRASGRGNKASCSGVFLSVNRVYNYLLGLLCIGATFPLGSEPRRKLPRGIRVFPGRTCGDDIDSNRLLVVRYLPGDRYFLNSEPADEVQLRQLVRKALQRRVEKIVWIAADGRVTYGEVVSLLSKLQMDTPGLIIAVATASQTGPVEPAEIERMGGKRADGTYIGVMPCVFADWSQLAH